MVKSDTEYQGLLTTENDTLPGYIKTIAEPLGAIKFPQFYVTSLKEKRGNFFSTASSHLVTDKMGFEVIKSVLPEPNEFYPIVVEDVGELVFVNIFTKLDALNADDTRWRKERDDSRRIILKYEFYADKLITAPCLFKIPEHRYTKLITVTGRPDVKDDFYTKYHETGLTGLKFEKLWTDED